METIAIKVQNVSKMYKLYEKPSDRFKESLGLTKKKLYQEHYALRDVSFQVNKGETVGIIGTNGAGKSTMLKIITGVLNPSGGSVVMNGRVSALLELGAGFNGEYTGIENIYLNGTMMGYTEGEMKKRVQAIVDFADIGEFVNQPVKTYSSGMFARLAFAVSINVEPEILIVDEALSVGDMRFQVKCIEKMKELKENGTTILFVSHATEQIKRFCTRTVWLKDGKVKEDGEASQIVDLYENFMKYGEKVLKVETGEEPDKQKTVGIPNNSDIVASITNVRINNNFFHTFERLEVKVDYEIYDEKVDNFLVGVAIYTKDRKEYIFGPNTYLDKIQVPNEKGRHSIQYVIPKIALMSGDYVLDVGIFSNEGIVNFDYKMSCEQFTVANEYISEGQFYLEHEWNIMQ